MKITEIILLVASVITALGVIFGAIKVILGMIVKKMLEPITNSVASIDKRNCRRHLIDFLHDVENGEEKDDVQIKFAYEIYDYYTNVLHENSYIHDKWEKVMLNGERK